MSVTFTKLFSSITASTVWCRPSDTRVVWITMLAMADKRGRVWASIPGLAKEALVSVEACRTAISEFLAPDPDSRTKVAEGRRIEPIDGGWRLINHAKYRAIRDEEERRAYKAEKQREYRNVDNVDTCGPPLNIVDSCSHNAEAEAEAEEQKHSRVKRERKTKTAISDERHTAFKEAIQIYWDSKNHGVQMPWGPAEGKQLAMWLREAPHITLEQFKGFLRARYKSDVNHGDRPCQWIKWITSYGPGPVDRFKNTAKEDENGRTGKGKPGITKLRLDGTLTALGEALAKRGVDGPWNPTWTDGETVSEPGERSDNRGVSDGLRATSPEILPPED
jgi:hypothetical protein